MARIRDDLHLAEEPARKVEAVVPTTERSFDAAGTDFAITWPAISGATGVEVDTASLTLRPLAASSPGRALSALADARDGTEVVLTIPGGARAIRSLTLNGFAVFAGEWRNVYDQADLPGGWRVAVSIPQGNGFSAPAYAVPGVELNRGIIPTLLAGSSLSDRVLRLPDVEAPRFRLQVLSGDFPDGLRPERFRVISISGRAAPEPVDLEALDAGGQSLWQQQGRLSAAAVIDLKAAVKRTLEQAITAGQGPRTTVTVRAGKPGVAAASPLATSGRVLRRVTEKLTVTCEGDARTFAVPGAPLDARRPHRAVADLVVRHHGLRLHPLSDPVPDRPGDLAGTVLSGNAAVVRVLPPQALQGEELRRIGLVAVVREPATVSVRILEVVGETPTGPLGSAQATASVEPAPAFAAASPRVVWLDLPDPLPVDRPLAIEASATRGRIHWVGLDGGAPRVRLAVTLADPTGTQVNLGDLAIALAGPRTELLGQVLPVAAFAGSPPVAATDQFCDVVLTNLTLEYLP